MLSVHQKHGLIYATDTEHGDAWIFSRRGLLRSVLRGNRKIKRGWNGEVQEINLQPGNNDPGNNRRKLSSRDGIRQVIEQHREARSRFGDGERIPPCRTSRYEQDRENFRDIYGTVPILPPDQYRSLLVNLTQGCSHNRCTFCHFYRGRTFDVKSSDSLRSHLQEIRKFFGPDLEYFTGVFIGAGDALTAPMERLVETLRRLGSCEIPVQCDVAGFSQGNVGVSKSVEELNRLHDLGLERVYLGLETGSGKLLEKLNKPFTLPEFEQTVYHLKRAGIDLGLIVLLGVGGKGYRTPHRRKTLKLLRQLPLDENDCLYLSPLVGSGVGFSLSSEDADPLDSSDMKTEETKFRREVPSELTVARYNVESFLY